MGRAPCCEKVGLKRGPWTAQEDQILINFINLHGHANWRKLPKLAGLLRCGKSCRLRWINYLRPDIKRGNFTKEEEDTIIKLHQELGNKWSEVAAKLPGRTDNEIKNVWNTHLKKRLLDDHDNNQSPKIKKRSRKTKSKTNKSTDDQENTKPSTGMQNSSPSNSSVDDDTIHIADHGMITTSSSASSSSLLISDTVNKLMEMEDIDVISADLSCIISNAIADDDDHAFDFDSNININMNMNMHDDDVEFWYNIYTKDEGQLEELLMDLF